MGISKQEAARWKDDTPLEGRGGDKGGREVKRGERKNVGLLATRGYPPMSAGPVRVSERHAN